MIRILLTLFLFISINMHANVILDIDNFVNTIYTSKNTSQNQLANSLPHMQEKLIIDGIINTSYISHFVIIFCITLVLILSVSSFFLYKKNKIEIKNNKLLQKQIKELEAKKQKSEIAIKSKSNFLESISKELKTPLNAIHIISEILMEENLKNNQIEHIVSLKISANYLLNLINDVLHINKIESLDYNLEESEFNLDDKIEAIQKSLYEIAKLNNVTCHYNIDPNIPKDLIGYKSELNLILLNLISNAIKHNENGIVSTNIKLVSKTNQTLILKFEVIDNGIGIPLSKQKNIFNDFIQATPDIHKKFGGLGLGLTLVKKLLVHLKSDIHLVSEAHKGSTFSFELEFKEPKNFIELNNDLDFSIFKNQEILIVEDNQITQVITQKLIEKHGAISTIAQNGTEALNLAKNNHYDLILMDINLPDFNGDIATLEIRKTNKHTPIIAFTAIHDKIYLQGIIENGIDDFITKPLDTRKFYEKIIRALKPKVV